MRCPPFISNNLALDEKRCSRHGRNYYPPTNRADRLATLHNGGMATDILHRIGHTHGFLRQGYTPHPGSAPARGCCRQSPAGGEGDKLVNKKTTVANFDRGATVVKGINMPKTKTTNKLYQTANPVYDRLEALWDEYCQRFIHCIKTRRPLPRHFHRVIMVRLLDERPKMDADYWRAMARWRESLAERRAFLAKWRGR